MEAVICSLRDDIYIALELKARRKSGTESNISKTSSHP